jgi:hypothetical protein
VAEALGAWITTVDAKTGYIEPRSSWENGYCESFNSKLRDELLNGEICYTLTEAKIVIENWRRHYNTVRPHSSLGYRPPAPASVKTVGTNRKPRLTSRSDHSVGPFTLLGHHCWRALAGRDFTLKCGSAERHGRQRHAGHAWPPRARMRALSPSLVRSRSVTANLPEPCSALGVRKSSAHPLRSHGILAQP